MRPFPSRPSAAVWALVPALAAGCDLWLVEPATRPAAVDVSFALVPGPGAASAAEAGDNLLVRIESDGHERHRQVVLFPPGTGEVRLRLDAPFEGEESTLRVDAILRQGEQPLLEAVSLIPVRRGESLQHEMTLRDLPGFPDPALDTAVRTAVGRPSGSLVTLDFREMHQLSAMDAGISDLRGLEHAIDLRRLNLIGNQVVDLTPIQGLTGLEALDLQLNRIADLAPLSALTGLTDLGLSGNEGIADLSPLGDMVLLERLEFSQTLVSDLGPLSNLERLVRISAVAARIADLSPLAGLTSLAGLSLSGNEIEDLAPLAGLTRISFLTLEHNRIRSLAGLAGLPALRTIHLTQNEITDLQPLVENPGMGAGADLRVGHNPLSTKACQEDIPALQARGVSVEFFASC